MICNWLTLQAPIALRLCLTTDLLLHAYYTAIHEKYKCPIGFFRSRLSAPRLPVHSFSNEPLPVLWFSERYAAGFAAYPLLWTFLDGAAIQLTQENLPMKIKPCIEEIKRNLQNSLVKPINTMDCRSCKQIKPLCKNAGCSQNRRPFDCININNLTIAYRKFSEKGEKVSFSIYC